MASARCLCRPYSRRQHGFEMVAQRPNLLCIMPARQNHVVVGSTACVAGLPPTRLPPSSASISDGVGAAVVVDSDRDRVVYASGRRGQPLGDFFRSA